MGEQVAPKILEELRRMQIGTEKGGIAPEHVQSRIAGNPAERLVHIDDAITRVGNQDAFLAVFKNTGREAQAFIRKAGPGCKSQFRRQRNEGLKQGTGQGGTVFTKGQKTEVDQAVNVEMAVVITSGHLADHHRLVRHLPLRMRDMELAPCRIRLGMARQKANRRYRIAMFPRHANNGTTGGIEVAQQGNGRALQHRVQMATRTDHQRDLIEQFRFLAEHHCDLPSKPSTAVLLWNSG